ncbi:MAG: Mur ligase family protein, partial [Candidatus Actinomarina sp.]
KNYLEAKVNSRGNKNLNYLNSFFSETELSILSEKTVSIVGTNGKSSTANNIAMLLEGLGKSYIAFTSPHLYDYKERITSHKDLNLNQYIEYLENFELENNIILGYFESTFLIAAKAFLHNNLDYFICEAGIGGKYDTTSIIQSKTVVLTSIGLDHTDLLGNKLTDILDQKIYVSNNIETLFVSVLNEDLIEIIKSEYTNYSKSIFLSEYLNNKNISFSKLIFKDLNYYLSLMVVDLLLQDIKYADLTNIKIKEAKGRFEIVNDSPVKIIDGAHNYEGVEMLLRNYENKYGHLTTDIFFGFKKGKDINNILNLIIGKTNYNLHLIKDDTFLDQEITKEIGHLLDKHGKNYKIASLEQFKKNKNPSILLGSLYLIGEYKKREL